MVSEVGVANKHLHYLKNGKSFKNYFQTLKPPKIIPSPEESSHVSMKILIYTTRENDKEPTMYKYKNTCV